MNNSRQTSQVENAIRKIEDRYAIGQKILKACGPTSPHGLIAELADQYGINRDSAQKFRAMAARDAGPPGTSPGRWPKTDSNHRRSVRRGTGEDDVGVGPLVGTASGSESTAST